jgi:hypothetical protein
MAISEKGQTALVAQILTVRIRDPTFAVCAIPISGDIHRSAGFKANPKLTY